MACFVMKLLRLSMAFCDLYSWINPIITFSITARIITPASITSPIAYAATAATIKSPIKISTNWDRNSIYNGVGGFSAISFKPYSFCLFSASLELSPSSDVSYRVSMSLMLSP